MLIAAAAVLCTAPRGSKAAPVGRSILKPALAALHSYSYVGKQQLILQPGKQVQLINHRGAGCLTYMWFAGGWKGFDHTVIRIYINGSITPCISMQLGMGHGMGYRVAKPWGVGTIGQTGIPSGVIEPLMYIRPLHLLFYILAKPARVKILTESAKQTSVGR